MAKPIRHRDKWRIRWTDATGKRRSEVYERYEDAEFKLLQHQTEAAEVRRGLRTLRAPDKTIGDLCDHWLAVRAPDKRSASDDRSMINAHLRPFFSEILARDVGQHIARYKATKSHLHKNTVNHHLTLLIAMLNEARDHGWLGEVPKIRKYKVPRLSADYRYLKTEGEIRRFLSAAQALPDRPGDPWAVDLWNSELCFDLYATAIYTGMRAGELAGLAWSSVDFDRRLVSVRCSFDGPTKNGESRYVPILDPLLPVLRERRLRVSGELVFTNMDGRMLGRSARVFQETLHGVLKRGGFPSVSGVRKTHRYIVFHDLRHTFASHWVMNGGDIFRLQKILGHKDIQMTMRYAHLAPDAYRDDFSRLGSSIVGEVVPFGSRKSGSR